MYSNNHGLCKVNIVFYFNDRLTDFMCLLVLIYFKHLYIRIINF